MKKQKFLAAAVFLAAMLFSLPVQASDELEWEAQTEGQEESGFTSDFGVQESGESLDFGIQESSESLDFGVQESSESLDFGVQESGESLDFGVQESNESAAQGEEGAEALTAAGENGAADAGSKNGAATAGSENAAAAADENAEAAAVSEPPSIEGAWEGDGEDWQYRLPDGTYLEKSWLWYGGQWYYLGTDGYMETGFKRIHSVQYYFRESGAMAVGWIYDGDTEKWYYAKESGELQKGWLQKGDAWYWFDSKGEMFQGGYRMIDGHKYYFFDNGQMAANQYVGLNYYNGDGIKENKYDITIQGKRKPDAEEKDRITKVMGELPRRWVEKFCESGWEFMYYTDKEWFAAPKTEQGIYFVYHKTDTNYKKLKFTNPDTLALAFGEYVAWATGNDGDENGFMADYDQYIMESGLVTPLPSYFDSDSSMQFGSLFQNYCREEVRTDMKRLAPDLFLYMEETLGVSSEELRPSVEEMLEMETTEEPGVISNGVGPAHDQGLGQAAGPAASLYSASSSQRS